MAGVKSLAKDTVIYGVSSIVGRFLNWCFVFLYINALKSTADYGIVTNLYAYMALLLTILTYGMETGLFRFINDDTQGKPLTVYTTTLISIGTTSSLFMAGVLLFLQPLSQAMGYPQHTNYVWMMALIIAMDAFSSIPFAYLRYQKKPIRFAAIRLLSIGVNIACNLFFILLCPYLYKTNPSLIDWFFDPHFLVGYILVSNILSSGIVILALLPEIVGIHYTFDGKLLKKMLHYSLPLLVLGIAGVMNQSFDKMLYPLLAKSRPDHMSELGIYGAGYKIAVVMVMFTQAFRYAYEPFIFSKNRGEGNKHKAYADAMKYFTIFGLVIFLGVCFYLDLAKLFVPPIYQEGFGIVPIVLLGELCFGIFFNLSLWYKLTDKTAWGAWFSLIGFAITIAINILFVPTHGYIACAWATLICYFAMMIISYIVGQRIYPIAYETKKLLGYTALALILYAASIWITFDHTLLNYTYRTLLLLGYIAYIIKMDLPLAEIPIINKYIKK